MDNSKSILTVGQLTQAIKRNLEGSFSSLLVKGEITNWKPHSSGHYYFTLKDKEAQIFCALFRSDALKISPLPKDGDLVVAMGALSVFVPKGNYQLIVRTLRQEGLGDLLLHFQELKAKFSALGWFDTARKKKISPFPKTIGVVTSPSGAVIQDILHVLKRRHKGFHLVLNPVLVQGDGAASQIAKAIEDFNRYELADVLIVGRGGGSLEDLWAFNEEVVAFAIYNSKIPIISAVGHETDFSIADFVADIRAPTPTAAAELVACDKAQEILKLQVLKQRIEHSLKNQLRNQAQKLLSLQKRPEMTSASKLLKDKYLLVDQSQENLDRAWSALIQMKHFQRENILKRLLSLSPQQKIYQQKAFLTKAKESLNTVSYQSLFLKRNQLTSAIQHFLALKPQNTILHLRETLNRITAHLTAIDPKNLLKKGYAIVFHQNSNSVILSIKELSKEEPIKIQMQDGHALAAVKEITHESR